MERTVKYAGLILSAVIAAGVIGGSVSKSVARDVVAPVQDQVTTLKAQRVEDARRLDRMEGKIDRILDRVK